MHRHTRKAAGLLAIAAVALGASTATASAATTSTTSTAKQTLLKPYDGGSGRKAG